MIYRQIKSSKYRYPVKNINVLDHIIRIINRCLYDYA